ncbi:unnamed protein product [Laminaria digitata]
MIYSWEYCSRESTYDCSRVFGVSAERSEMLPNLTRRFSLLSATCTWYDTGTYFVSELLFLAGGWRCTASKHDSSLFVRQVHGHESIDGCRSVLLIIYNKKSFYFI